MTWIAVIVLSLIEGLTEFLPVSSTGHLILAGRLFVIPNQAFLASFLIIIQVGAILAVLEQFWSQMIANRRVHGLLVGALLPFVLAGMWLHPLLTSTLLVNPWFSLLGLVLGSVGLFLAERKLHISASTRVIEQLRLSDGLMLGLFQLMALLPGFSRSAAVIMGGIFLGLSRKQAVLLSFLLGLPVIVMAGGFELTQLPLQFGVIEGLQLTLGVVVSYFVAKLTIRLMMEFVKRHSLAWFAYYRLGLVLVYLAWLM